MSVADLRLASVVDAAGVAVPVSFAPVPVPVPAPVPGHPAVVVVAAAVVVQLVRRLHSVCLCRDATGT